MAKVTAPTEETALIPLAELLPIEYTSTIPDLVADMRETLLDAQGAVANFPQVNTEEEKDRAFILRESIRTAMNDFNGERMPFTRQLDLIKKEFTTMEAEFQALIDKLDANTASFGRKQLENQRTKEAEANKKAALDQAKIDLQANIKVHLQQQVSAFLDLVRTAASNVVSGVTKETLEEDKLRLKKDPKWTPKMDTAYHTVPNFIFTPEETTVFNEIANEEKVKMQEYYQTRGKTILADSSSLLEVALANQEEAEKMLQANLQTQKAQENTDQAEIVAHADGMKTLASMDSQSEVPTANVKITWKIDQSKLKRGDWLKLVAFFFEFDPKKEDDLSKKTFMQCLKFAEEKVNKDGTRLDTTKHPNIVYIEDVKARK